MRIEDVQIGKTYIPSGNQKVTLTISGKGRYNVLGFVDDDPEYEVIVLPESLMEIPLKRWEFVGYRSPKTGDFYVDQSIADVEEWIMRDADPEFKRTIVKEIPT